MLDNTTPQLFIKLLNTVSFFNLLQHSQKSFDHNLGIILGFHLETN